MHMFLRFCTFHVTVYSSSLFRLCASRLACAEGPFPLHTQNEAGCMTDDRYRMFCFMRGINECNFLRYGEKNVAYAESHDQALVGDKTIAFWLMDKGTSVSSLL